MKQVYILLILFLTGVFVSSVVAEPKVAVTAVMVVKTVDQNQVSDRVIQKVESWGGYFVQRQDTFLTLKLPRGYMKEFIAFVKTEWGILKHTYDTEDLSSSLNEISASLTAKKELLDQYLTLVETANSENVLSVEREMSKLIGQIETLEGQMRLAEHQLKFANVSVQYQFKSRETPKADGRSSFPWLNKVNLTDLLVDFR